MGEGGVNQLPTEKQKKIETKKKKPEKQGAKQNPNETSINLMFEKETGQKTKDISAGRIDSIKDAVPDPMWEQLHNREYSQKKKQKKAERNRTKKETKKKKEKEKGKTILAS